MNKFLLLITSVAMLSMPALLQAQAPTLGTAANFALFTTNGAVTNTGMSHLTGNVGTNNGSSTNFGNVDGVMQDGNGASAAAAADLTIAYNQLNAAIPNYFPAPLLGNGAVLVPGIYSIGQSATLNGTLTLDGQNDPNAIFIFKVQGSFATSANAQVLLTNGALACNVFWKVEGLFETAANTVFKGTIVANNAAIILNTGTIVEGRALSTTGAVSVAGATVVKPRGCGSVMLTGPAPASLGTVACYTIFSGSGEVTNSGISIITGDVGTNVGLTTGFQAENVAGTIHSNPDVSTAQCAADLNTVYTYLNTLPVDIELLYPAAFGNDLVLTPHTYLLNGATVLNGTVTLNGQNNPNAVFVLKINGALSTSTYANVVLINDADPKNVFWKVDGAVNLNDYTNFKGTVICNNGAMILNTGVSLTGRALSTTGGVTTFGIGAHMTPGCTLMAVPSNTTSDAKVKFYPNPFSSSINVTVENMATQNELLIYNTVGAKVLQRNLTQTTTNIEMNLPTGVYFYKVIGQDGSIQTGKLLSKQ